jgi:hypothetical protein
MEMQEEIERQQEEEKKRLKVSEEVKVMEVASEKEKEYNYHQQMMDQYRIQRFGDTSLNPDDDPSNYKRHKPLQKLSESTV